MPIHQIGYLTDLLGNRAVDVDQRLCEVRPAVPAQPAFQRAALAVGRAGRRGRVRTRARRHDLLDFDGGTQKTYQRMVEADGHADRPRAAGAGRERHRDNTIVIFTSDNGGERFADTWPFTGRKTELLEGGLRIPALISLAGAHSAGPDHGSGRDQHGLAADAAGRRRHRTGSGLSARRHEPAAGADAERGARRRASCSGATKPMRSARRATATRSILKILDNTFLFNVVDDPLERANLKDRHKDIYERLVAEWREWNADHAAGSQREHHRQFHRDSSPTTSARRRRAAPPTTPPRRPPARRSERAMTA